MSCGVYQPRKIGRCDSVCGVYKVDGVHRQDGRKSTAEGVGVHAGEIVLIDGRRQDRGWGGGWGFHGRWKRPTRRSIKANRCPHRVSTTKRNCFNISRVVFIGCLYFRPSAVSAPCLLLHAQGIYLSDTYITTQVIIQPPQYLYPAINYLDALANTSIIMTPSISDTKTLPSVISEHTPLFLDYDSDLSPSMIQQFGVKW